MSALLSYYSFNFGLSGHRPLTWSSPLCGKPRKLIHSCSVHRLHRRSAHIYWCTNATDQVPKDVRSENIPAKGPLESSSGSLFGAVALITGSTVGAGMLALPSVTAPAGLAPTFASLLFFWALLTLEALALAEVNISLREMSYTSSSSSDDDAASLPDSLPRDKIIPLRQMAESTLGTAGKSITLVYLGLAYSLLIAYLSKITEVLGSLTGNMIPPAATACIFVVAAGTLFLTGGNRAADSINQALTSVLLLLFGCILAAGLGQGNAVAAVSGGNVDWSAIEPAIPIVFLALVYHDLVPVICTYLRNDRDQVKTAIVFGSIIPLAMFLSWEAVALGLLPGYLPTAPQPALIEASLGMGSQLIGSAIMTIEPSLVDNTGAAPIIDPLEILVLRCGPDVGVLVRSFSFLAVMTSFLGTCISLRETLRSEVPTLIEMALDRGRSSVRFAPPNELALILTLGPPLMVTILNPDAFMSTLSAAGGYGMTLLYGLLPPVMLWALRSRVGQSSMMAHQVLVPGGRPVLGGLFAIASLVAVNRIGADMGFFR